MPRPAAEQARLRPTAYHRAHSRYTYFTTSDYTLLLTLLTTSYSLLTAGLLVADLLLAYAPQAQLGHSTLPVTVGRAGVTAAAAARAHDLRRPRTDLLLRDQAGHLRQLYP